MISKTTEDKILGGCDVVDVFDHYNISLKRSGKDYTCLSPFRDDRNYGSFIVSKSKNLVTDYSSNEHWNPVRLVAMFEYGKSDALTVKEHYPDILRILADIAKVVILEDGGYKVKSNYVPRPKPEPLKPVYFNADIVVKPFLPHVYKNPLVNYMLRLPLNGRDMQRLQKAIHAYAIGTYPSGKYEGWTIWWYIDDAGYVRSGKLMKYKADGHRDKSTNSTWAHSLMSRWKYHKDGTKEERAKWLYDQETHEPNLKCLFGQHLLNFYPDAVIRVVESEKTAVLCSAFTDMKKCIWMATGGKSGLSGERFAPLIRKQRQIELYPDKDAMDEWKQIVQDDELLSKYALLTISPKMRDLWTEADGEKADIADIMFRIVNTPKAPAPPPPPQEPSLSYKVAVSMDAPEKAGVIEKLINALNLRTI